MDFGDFEQENQNCKYAEDNHDQGNDPEITSVTRTVNEALKSAPAKRQKSGGKKQGAVWDYFTQHQRLLILTCLTPSLKRGF